MSGVKDKAKKEKHAENSERSRTSHWLFSRRGPGFLASIFSSFDNFDQRITPYIKKGQVVADLGCGWGSYSFKLADLVGREGKVYAVDLANKCIQKIHNMAEERGYHNIKAFVSSASNLSFIKAKSVDFVFANGLLCSMAINRQSAVAEIKRILKPRGKAYLSLGMPPPFGYVNEAEWKKILSGFKVDAGGSFNELWVLVSSKQRAA